MKRDGRKVDRPLPRNSASKAHRIDRKPDFGGESYPEPRASDDVARKFLKVDY